MESRRKFTKEFKLDAVARSLEVNREDLYRWSRDVEKFGVRAFPGVGQKRWEETRIAELERKIGQQVLEIDFLKRALQHVEVYRSEYRNRAEARIRISDFLDQVYNQKRLHSSLGYRPPVEFERFPLLGTATAALTEAG